MENKKIKKIFRFLFVITILLVLNLGSVFAVNRIFNLTATYNGQTLTDGQTIEVASSASRTINISVNPTYTNTLKIGYIWDSDSIKIASENSKTASITIPNYAEGTSHTLKLEAIINDTEHNYIGNSNVVTLTVKIPSSTKISVDLKDGSTTVSSNATIEKKAGTTLTIVTSSNKNVAKVAYRWNTEGLKEVSASTATITVPNYAAGSSNKLAIQALSEDGVYSEGKAYTIKIPKVNPLTGDISVKYNNNLLANNSTTTISVGSKVVITGSPAENFATISGTWQINNNTPTNISFSNASTTLDIPGAEGQTVKLTLVGTLKDGVKTSIKTYIFKIPSPVVPLTGNVSVKNGSVELLENVTNELSKGAQITLSGSPADNFTKLTYKWDSELEKDISGSNGKIVVPSFEAGSEHLLTIMATLKDGNILSQKIYKIRISAPSIEPIPDPNPDEEEEEKLTGNVIVKMNDSTLSNNSSNVVNGNETLELIGSPARNFSSLRYKWDDGDEIEVAGGSANIKVLAEEGYIHKLKVYGVLKDNGKTSTKTYNFIINGDDELIIESWMRENSNAEGLLVSLRNDTEEDKANKNFYMLDEEVIYYVDYKNCEKDINEEIKLVLELPLKFDIVDSAGGIVSKSDKTITWIFPDGLEEEQSGTKEVVVKYTELSKNSYDYEIVYPESKIYLKSKTKDASAVINYIYVSDTTVIEDTHEPYMFGDEESPTFRPDDTITRAEGALVLTRIFGIKTSNVKITNKYSDINETYLEAQKAIIAASNLGIISGYEDGTYRPKEKMTRAEFMKIIASYIEVMGDEKKIDGLEIKEESNIKIYKNTTNRNHWAINYVTLLVRLNMTSVSKSNKDLRLDDEITRAEAAQLINFYLLRAPAKVSTSTKVEFIDVQRTHDLFGDIVEATRNEHKYVITEDGKEKAK